MNLRQLEAFRAVYLTGSVSRAAEALHVSQPSVSRLLADLQATIGLRLFIRAGRGLEPTPEAQHLFKVVDRAFVGVSEIADAAAAIRTLKSGTLSLGAVPAFAFSIVPEAIAVQQARSSDTRFHVSVATTRSVIESVEAGKLDLGLISPISDERNTYTLYRKVTRYVCAIPAEHPLARRRTPVDLLELRDESFVTFDRTYLDFLRADPRLLDFIQSRSRLSSHSAPVIAALARATKAIAIVDPFTARFFEAMGDVVCRPMKQPLRYEVALIARSEGSVSLLGREFATVIEELISRGVPAGT